MRPVFHGAHQSSGRYVMYLSDLMVKKNFRLHYQNFPVSDMEIQSPRFTGSSWLAFPALRGAYKHVQLSLELRPEAFDGIFFLTGERDDMAGDFMALLLHQGFVEFR